MQRKVPLRQCTGCRAMKPKKELVRVVRSTEGKVFLDFSGKASGRGAYVCRDGDCLKKAVKTRALPRVLGVQIPDGVYAALGDEISKQGGVTDGG